MKWIKKKRMTQDRQKGLVHTYIVVDEAGNEEDITTLQEFQDGERVETWFDDKWNVPKMRPYKEKRPKCNRCHKEIIEPVAHEFCHVKHTSEV